VRDVVVLPFLLVYRGQAREGIRTMITADQLLAHVVGDFVLQSDWMANEKTARNLAALAHAACYTLPFLLLTTQWAALAVIGGTHFLIDRFRLVRYLIWARNLPWPGSRPWRECRETPFSPGTPAYMSAWLLVIVDNAMHVLINGLAIRYFG
jgi:hypothetical protein